MYNSHIDCKNQMSRTNVIVALSIEGQITVNTHQIRVHNFPIPIPLEWEEKLFENNSDLVSF